MLLGNLLHRKDNRRVGHVVDAIIAVNVDPASRGRAPWGSQSLSFW
jgi:hypothetical protein